MNIEEWQSAPSVIRIQNVNYVAGGLQNFMTSWKAFNGCLPSTSNINIAQAIDTRVRIPIHDSAHNDGMSAIQTVQDFNSQAGGQGAWGNGLTAIFNNMDILEYIPRLYVELKPLSEYLKTLSGWYSQFFAPTFDFFFYSVDPTKAGQTYRFFNPDNYDLSKQYVLNRIIITTNIPGQQQTKLEDKYQLGRNTGMYDVFIPFEWKGVQQPLPTQAYGYLPYIHQFLPTHNEYGTPRASVNMVLGECGRLGELDGLKGMNVLVAAQNGAFSPEHFMNIPFGNQGILKTYAALPWLTFHTADKAMWEKVFSASGMPWSYNLDDVLSPNDDNLHKPTFPGQPDNPTGGGEGDGDNMSDDIPLPDVTFFPNNNAYNRYWLTPAQLPDLQDWIFSQTFFNDIQRLWNDPAEYLINLTFYPFDGRLHDVNHVVSDSFLSIGNLTSEIRCSAMQDGYSAVFEGGTYEVKEYYGTYLDYAPYTTAEIYIPYIGYRNLNINDIMNKTLRLMYVVDFDTNLITATLLADEKPLTMYSGSFGVKIALSGTNANQVAETITKIAIGTIESAAGIVSKASEGNKAGAIASGIEAATGLLSGTMDVQISPRYFGNPSPSTALYNTQIPHIIFHRPITAEPAAFSTLKGYSAGYSGKVSDFSGFLKCSAVYLPADTTMSAAEQEAAKNILLGGIYL